MDKTKEPPYASKLVNAQGELIPPPVAARRKPRHLSQCKGKVMRSSRYFRAKWQETWDLIERGKVTAAEGVRRASVLKLGLEMHMAGAMLDMQGLDHPLDLTPHPEEGYEPAPPVVQGPRVKRVSVTRGRGRHGEVVDTKTVVMTGTGDDGDLEPVAEIEALT